MEEARKGNDRRGQDRGHTEEGAARRARRLDSARGRRLRADRPQVPARGRPLAQAAQAEGARERAAPAVREDGRLVARRRLPVLEEAAAHGDEGLREAPRRDGVHGQLLHRAALREAPEGADGRGARRQGRPGVPAALVAARRVPGRLRRGRLQGEGRHAAGQVPHGELPARQRRAHPGVLGRDVGVRLPGPAQRVRVRRGRAEEGRLRQRHGGRPARRRRGQGLLHVQGVRGPLRPGLHVHQPLLGQREGQRREQGRLPPQEPLRPRAAVPRRRGVQPPPDGGVPRPERRQAALQARHAGARAVRGRPEGPLAPAGQGLRVREVGHPQVQQAGRVHRGRAPPLLGRPGRRGLRGRRGARRLRGHGARRRDGRGPGGLRAAVGRRPHRQLRPHPPAQAAVHAPLGVARLDGPGGPSERPRRVPGLRAEGRPGGRPQGPARRERGAGVGRRRGGNGALARRDRRRGQGDGRALGGQGRLGGRPRGVRRRGRPLRGGAPRRPPSGRRPGRCSYRTTPSTPSWRRRRRGRSPPAAACSSPR